MNNSVQSNFREHYGENSTITEVSLTYDNIGDTAAKELAEALKVNSTITNMNLSGNYIGPEGATALADALKVNKTITYVDLGDNYIGPTGARALADALKVNKTITEVNLGDNNIGPEGATALAEALKVNKTITNVNLRNNNIGPTGARALAEALKVNKTITNVDLGWNNIEDTEASALAEALKVNKTITYVYLYWNNIGPEGARALADALKVNSTITDVDFHGNYIGSEGASALAEAFRENSTITKVDLRFNFIGPEGATALAEAFQENSTITEVNLDTGNNIIDTRVSRIIENSIEENQAISELNTIFINESKFFISQIPKKLGIEILILINEYISQSNKNIHVIQSSEKKYNNQKTNKNEKKKVFQSYFEFLELQGRPLLGLKEIKTPIKLLHQFITYANNNKFNFVKENMERRVKSKLERIVKSQYVKIMNQLESMFVSRSTTVISDGDLDYKGYEKILFDTHRSIILDIFVKINEQKIQTIQKKLAKLNNQDKNLIKYNFVKDKNKEPTSVKIKEQIDIKKQQLQQIREKSKYLQSNSNSHKSKSKMNQDKKIIQYKQEIEQLQEIKNLKKVNETVLKFKRIEQNILFFMLPDTFERKYFTGRGWGKRKRSQNQMKEQKNCNAAKRSKTQKKSPDTKQKRGIGMVTSNDYYQTKDV